MKHAITLLMLFCTVIAVAQPLKTKKPRLVQLQDEIDRLNNVVQSLQERNAALEKVIMMAKDEMAKDEMQASVCPEPAPQKIVIEQPARQTCYTHEMAGTLITECH